MAPSIISSLFSLALAATTVNGHAFFHTGYVNGKFQGHLFGVRAPASNSPIEDVSSSAITCNSPLYQPVSKDVIEVAPGDKFGMQWNHGLDGPTPGDADDPIASSHKGPVMVYMAKVDDASTSDGSGLNWFKVAEEGFDTSTKKWGVDTLIANAGLWSFTMPSLAPGDYLLRGELIALHSASSEGGAQFYMSCAGIRVSGSGTCSPSDTVSFPGAYKATDPGILISIYGNTGSPDNGGKPYTVPGPAVATCDGSSSAASSSAAHSSTQSATSSSVDATSKKSSSQAAATTLSTVSRPPPFSNSTTTSRGAGATTQPWHSWTFSRPQQSKTHSRSAKPTSTSTSSHSAPGLPETGADTATQTSTIRVTPTNSATETGVKVPASSSTASAAPEDDDDVDGMEPTGSASATSAAQPSSSGGYTMTGPGGRKFVCYEVSDF